MGGGTTDIGQIDVIREPLVHSSVSHFSWWGKRVLDNDFECLAQSNIKELDLPIGQFTMDQLARLRAGISGLKGRAAMPYYESSIITRRDGEKTYYCLCKGKKRLEKGRDEEKLERYLEEYNGLIEKYKSEL